MEENTTTPVTTQPEPKKIRIWFLNNDGGGFADWVHVPEGATCREFFTEHYKDGNNSASDYNIRLNREPCTADQVLVDGDRLTITPRKVRGAK